jgi:type I restriction enzyme S subunit
MRETLVKTQEFKDSPLGRIPKDWNIQSLKNIATVTVAYVGATDPYYCGSDTGILFLRTGNITEKGIDLSDVRYVTKLFHEKTRKSSLLPGDVVVSRVGITGIAAVIPLSLGEVNCANMIIIRCSDSLLPQFLRRLFSWEGFSLQIRGFTAGSVQPVFNIALVERLLVPLPSKSEQSRIAEVIDTLDETIAHTSSLIAKLKQMKAGLLHDLLTRGLDENGELRDAIGHPEQFKDSPLGQIPKDWEAGKIGSHCEIHNHLRKPISAEERDLIRGHYPYYGPTGILDYINEYRVDGEYVLIGEDGDHFLKFTTQPMTLLVSGEFNVNNHAHILKGTERCHTEWIDLFFRHRDITLSLTRQGAGRFKLNKASLENLSLAVPPPDEQIAINKILETHENRIRAEEAYRDKLKLQKKGLMHDLLTGKVRVKDADKFTSASDTV